MGVKTQLIPVDVKYICLLKDWVKLFSRCTTVKHFRGFTIVFEILYFDLIKEKKNMEMSCLTVTKSTQVLFFPSKQSHTHLFQLPAWLLPGRHCWPEPPCPTQWAQGRRCWGLLAAGHSTWRCGSTVGSLCVAPLLSCAWLTCCCQGAGIWTGEYKFTVQCSGCFSKSHHIPNKGASHSPFNKRVRGSSRLDSS